MSRRSLAPLAGLALGLLVPAAVCAAEAGSLAECEVSYLARTEDWNGCFCFYRLAQQPELRSAVKERLRAIHQDRPGLACPLFYLGSLAFQDGEDPSAAFEQAAATWEENSQWSGSYYARLSFSRWLRGRSRFAEALEQMELAVTAARELEDPSLADAAELERLKLAMEQGGDLAEIEAAGTDLLARAGDRGPIELELEAADLVAQSRFRMGDFERAQRDFEQVAALLQERGDEYAASKALFNGAFSSLKGPRTERTLQQATGRLEAALAAAERSGNLRVQAAALHRLGRLTPGDEGLNQMHRAVEIGRRLKEPQTLYGMLLAYGEQLAMGGQPEKARRVLEEAAGYLPEDGTVSFLVEGWLHRNRIAWQLAPPEEALPSSLAILDEIEQLRRRQGAAQAEFFSLWLVSHQWVAGRLFGLASGRSGTEGLRSPLEEGHLEPLAVAQLESRWLEAAFHVQERMRARILSEGLRAGETEAGEALPDWDSLASLRQIQEALGPDEALLSWQLAQWSNFYDRFEGGSWLLAIHREGVRLYAHEDGRHFEPAVAHFAGLFDARDGGEAAVATRLEAQLLEPALAALPESVQHLILVPDGALNQLPFAGLRSSSGHSLASRYSLSIVPSADLWLRWRSRSPSTLPGRALLFADPTATDSWPSAQGGNAPGLRGRSEPWPPLPGARRETRLIRRALGRSGQTLTGSKASESALAEAAGSYSLLHFATHAEVGEHRGSPSGILLAAGSETEDGFVGLEEIAALDLPDTVAVLATCRGGGGRVLYGEGPLSLARAFAQAGASTVVASLWPLRDDEAADLFAPFYRHLARGRSVAAALAAAQQERAGAGAPAAAWAGVFVLGDGSAKPFPEGVDRGVPLGAVLAAAGLLLTVLLLGWRRRKGGGRRS